jgi:thiol:disulfide interchange protein DsbG
MKQLLPVLKLRMTRARHSAWSPTAFAAVVAFASTSATAQVRPPALQALEKQGVRIVGTFPSAGGLTAWAAYAGQNPVALYVTPDGKHVIAGSLLDSNGKDADAAELERLVHQPMVDGVLRNLEASDWVADGLAKAPRTVYVFTDLNCPYCNKFWSDARPWVESGKVQLRHVVVGVLTPTSPGKAAALLADKNPSALLASHERSNRNVIQPLANIPPAIQSKLDANQQLMAELGLHATPAVVWRDAKGAVHTQMGVPDTMLAEVLGPR